MRRRNRNRLSKTNPDWMAYSRAMAGRKSVVAVIVFRESGKIESGSGFVIKRDHHDSIILTSYHCMGEVDPEKGDVLRVRRPLFPRGVEQLPAIIIYQDELLDVAILKVAGLTCVPPLHFAQEDSLVGDSVISVGYCDPDALLDGVTFSRLPSLLPGLIRPEGTPYLSTVNGIDLYHVMLSCICMEGTSGGPIVSRRGVIGMVDGGGRGYTEAKAVRTIRDVLKMYLVSKDIQTVEQAEGLTMEEVLNLIV